MTSETKDGFTMTSTEQAGEWEGCNIGRVLILDDEGNYDTWKVVSVDMADLLVSKARSFTREEWIRRLDVYYGFRQALTIPVI